MFTLLMILIVLLGSVMTVAILMQNPKGGGLSSAFGGAGGGMGSMLGVRHASDILAKATWGLAAAMVVLIFALNMFFLPSEATQESIIQRQSSEAPISPMQKQEQMQQQAQPPQQQAQPQQQQAPADAPPPTPAPAN